MTQYSDDLLKSCDDAALALLVKDKSDYAFEVITSRYMKLISVVASKYRSSDKGYDMSDLIQEGLLGLYFSSITYDESCGTSFRNYAMLCIENRFRSFVRRYNKKSLPPKSSIVPMDDNIDHIEDINSMNIQESLESKDYIRSMYEKLSLMLSPLERRVFSRYLLGYSYKQTAKLLGISQKAVDNALCRIRKKLTR